MERREPNYRQKFRNSFRYSGSAEDGRSPKFLSPFEQVPETPTRAEREARMKQIDELALEQNPNRSQLIQLLRDKESELQTFSEELDNLVFQRHEMQEALTEAQTIIEQQQDQLSEFRKRAAQSQTDAEAFKMKNMFLSLGATTRDEQLHALTDACDRLEAEVEALTWQLDQNKRTLVRTQNERDYLQNQLNETEKLFRETVVADQMTTAATAVDVDASRSGSLGNDPMPVPPVSFSLQTDQLHTKRLENERYLAELNELRRELGQLKEREHDWIQTEARLLDRQRDLEDERQKQAARIDMLVLAQQRSPSEVDSELDTERRPVSRLSRQPDPGQLIELRRMTEERDKWKSYACGLVRTFVDHCEDFVRRTQYDEPEFHTIAERRWYDYSIYLLEILIDVAPQRLTESDLALLKRDGSRQTQRYTSTPTLSTVSVSSGPDLLSAVTLKRNVKKKLSTNERVARLARKSLFRSSHTK